MPIKRSDASEALGNRADTPFSRSDLDLAPDFVPDLVLAPVPVQDLVLAPDPVRDLVLAPDHVPDSVRDPVLVLHEGTTPGRWTWWLHEGKRDSAS